MTLRLSGSALLAALLTIAGCGYDSSTTADSVDVSGTVKGPDGNPLGNVTLFFVATEKGTIPTQFPLKADGAFAGKMTPGTYSYYVGPAHDGDKKGEALAQQLPESYKKASLDRPVKVKGGVIELKF